MSPLSRCLFTTLLVLLASGQGASAGPEGPIRLEPGRKQLFLDGHIVGEVRNLDRVMHRPTKRGAVLLPDRPWDGRFVATASAPMWIEGEGHYKLVYEGRPLKYSEEIFRWALATSRDGLVWEKPDLGAVEYRGSRSNNLIAAPEKKRLWHVVHDPDDPDPGRRYKGFLGHSGRRPVVSPDAVHWRILDVPKLPSGDAGTLTYDRERRQFLGLLKFGGKYGRSYNLSVSKDFVHWSEPRFSESAGARRLRGRRPFRHSRGGAAPGRVRLPGRGPARGDPHHPSPGDERRTSLGQSGRSRGPDSSRGPGCRGTARPRILRR